MHEESLLAAMAAYTGRWPVQATDPAAKGSYGEAGRVSPPDGSRPLPTLLKK
jgi:hypothetical protein